ncbi:coiled-coil domain-containing protein 43 isoform X1 [Eublepharis macularius]|uniref:Coiled-coil domain-containing protein 43 n=1 Tax=Eublepharis macularius TaxID=481883 RepID=A0AA97K7M9_EUBMA|nr:coiled-coil domain-containing protein 43 isoform X1 [Eublepharis macularius]
MAAPCGFEPWLEGRLEALGLDGDVYGGYVRGLLREAENDAERLEGLEAALAAGELDEDVLQEVCREIVQRWSEAQDVGTKEKKEDEIQAIASMIEKQAQIVVKPKEVSKEETLRKAALLAQYAEVTDEEEYPFCVISYWMSLTHPTEADGQDGSGAAAAAAAVMTINSEQSLFRNTNLVDVVNARKLERDHLRDESQRKKEQDKLQREKDKLAKQERKEKEKKRTQKGERKR